MAEFQFANNAFATIADSEVGTGATTINVTSDSTLPDLEAGKTVRVTGVQLDSNGDAQALEIMTLTAIDSNGTQLTVTRAQENTTAITLYAGDRIELRLTKAGLDSLKNELVPENAQTGTSYTLVIGDQSKIVTMTNASASTLTVPPNSSVAFAIGTQIIVTQQGAGQVTLTQGAGVTINAPDSTLTLRTQYSSVSLIKMDTNEWIAAGDLG